MFRVRFLTSALVCRTSFERAAPIVGFLGDNAKYDG